MLEKVIQLRLKLEGSSPNIWRKILISDNITFHKLHKILQAAMGWQQSHWYSFEVDDVIIEEKQSGIEPTPNAKSSKHIKISKFDFQRKDQFLYTYDFSNNWAHHIIIEKVYDPQEVEDYPVCLDGKNHCPSEDIGGIDEYNYAIKVLNNPNHHRYEELKGWIDNFDPKLFSIEEVNELLKKIK